jgi:hypothetical protein
MRHKVSMNSKIIAACAVILVGCEGGAYYNCPDPIFGKIGYEDGLPLTCAQISERARLARDLMEDSKMYPKFTPQAPNVKLFVYNAHGWDIYGTGVSGVAYYIGGSVDTDSWMASLVHEMFHIKDYNDSGFPLDGQGGHKDWDINGRYALASFYTYELNRLDPKVTKEFNCKMTLPLDIKYNLVDAGWGEDLSNWYKYRASYCDR